MPDLVPVRRALLSVSDKTGLIDFARALVDEFKVELVSTGGTARTLREAGLSVTDVSEVTGFPEILDGRVKTLHPKIHAGILADRDKPEHMSALEKHSIRPIDLVCVNLYPFEQTVARPAVSYEEAIENIDIGGPAMIRAAAKNHASVLVVTDPGRYEKVLGDLRKHGGSSCFKHRQKMAMKAFDKTSRYDSAILMYMLAPQHASMQKSVGSEMELRYGENPHQGASLIPGVREGEASVAHAIQHHGKQLGYINLLDADAALNVVKEFDEAACCIVKHATPCGVGIALENELATSRDRKGAVSGASPEPLPHGRGSLNSCSARAFIRAYEGDPLAAFGGIVAYNAIVDLEAARALVAIDKLLEVIVAPAFEPAALELLRDRWKNVRILEVGPIFANEEARRLHRQGLTTGKPSHRHSHMHQIVGGVLVQQRDLVGVVGSEWKVVTRRRPTDAEMRAMKFNWLVAKHVKSNAVVVGGEQGSYGIGGGQVDRVAAAQQAVKKAGERAYGAVAASDAFFPFPDGPQVLIQAGVTAIVQPGGSVRDQATIDLCDAAGVAMIFTGRRHFRH